MIFQCACQEFPYWRIVPLHIHQYLYMKFVKILPKFQDHLLFMATSTLPQNLQEAGVKICSAKFGCPLQESLPEFK